MTTAGPGSPSSKQQRGVDVILLDQRAACPSTIRGDEAERPWTRGELLQLALQYRAWGLSPIPVRGDKRPAVAWKPFQTRRATDRELGKLFDRPDVAGLGIVAGPVSRGLLTLDFDTTTAAQAWADENLDIASVAPVVRTRRGVHVHILAADRRPRYWRFAGGELLADDRHFAVWPPSPHPAGGAYQWLREPHRVADLPVLSTAELAKCLPPPVAPRTATPVSVSPPSLSPKSGPRTGAPDRQQTADSRKTSSAADRDKQHTSCVPRHPAVPLELAEREAVLRCVPTGPGERNDCLFRLARELKGLAHLADAGPADLGPHLQFWFALSIRVIGTKQFDASQKDFARQWRAVRTPAGFGLAALAERALSAPVPPGGERLPDPAARAIAALAAALQEAAGPNRPFFLSARTAARLCGCSRNTAWRRFNDLAAVGLLERTHRGVRGAGSKVAASFRWLGAAG